MFSQKNLKHLLKVILLVPYLKFALIFSFFILVSGCNLSLPTNNEQAFSYELSVNGCTTGKKVFSDLDSYCQGLQNNSANNNCAQPSRENLFYQKCSGSFNPFKLKIDLF